MAQLLVIDDNPSIVHLLHRSCTDLGHSVTTAHSGRTGMRQIREVIPEVVLVDLKLGDMTGIELMNEAKAEGCTARFVFITGCAEIPSAVEAMRGGAVNYLTKPIDLHILGDVIDRALQQAGPRRGAPAKLVMREATSWPDSLSDEMAGSVLTAAA
jgi:DNA-binding NtrC family response regulator